MYVKLFNRILDSSLAKNRPLRHFFTDLLLLADPDGNVTITKDAIHQRTRAPMEEIEWGLKELMKPDPGSMTLVEGGRRIIPLEGHGYGWKIVNYEMYRDYKSAQHMRQSTAERVRKWREKKKSALPKQTPSPGEKAFEKAVASGNEPLADHLSEPKVKPDHPPGLD